MNNNVYGKAVENLRNRLNKRLVPDAKNFERLISKLSFVSQKMFREDLVLIHNTNKIKSIYA